MLPANCQLQNVVEHSGCMHDQAAKEVLMVPVLYILVLQLLLQDLDRKMLIVWMDHHVRANPIDHSWNEIQVSAHLLFWVVVDVVEHSRSGSLPKFVYHHIYRNSDLLFVALDVLQNVLQPLAADKSNYRRILWSESHGAEEASFAPSRNHHHWSDAWAAVETLRIAIVMQLSAVEHKGKHFLEHTISGFQL